MDIPTIDKNRITASVKMNENNSQVVNYGDKILDFDVDAIIVDEQGKPCAVHGEKPDPFLQQEQAGFVAQRRNKRQLPAHPQDRRGLRSGRPPDLCGQGRSRLPHGRGKLLFQHCL